MIIDTLRADHLGCYGNPVMRTPSIDGLAAQGMRFTHVYPEAMPTVPARRSMMTGRRIFPFRNWEPWRGLGESGGWAPIFPSEPTIAKAMHRAGYWTGYVTDTPSLAFAGVYESFRNSFDDFRPLRGQNLRRGITHRVPPEEAIRRLPGYLQHQPYIDDLRAYMANNGFANGAVEETGSATARVFSEGIDALKKVGRRRGRFFLTVDAFDPHEPWAIPEKYLDMYRPAGSDFVEIGDIRYGPVQDWRQAELERVRMTYAAGVTMADRWLGELLHQLESMGLADSTVVMLASDHGILLGERDWVGKNAWLLHPEMMHVPMIIRHPDGRGGGETSDWWASTHDVAPTLMSLAAGRRPDGFEGADLSPILDGDEPDESRDFAYGGYANDLFVRHDKWAFVSDNQFKGNRLYDVEADPGERRDLSAEEPDVVSELYEMLLGEIGERPPFYTEEQRYAEPLQKQDLASRDPG